MILLGKEGWIAGKSHETGVTREPLVVILMKIHG
jgi:hypothetical protein